MNTLEIVRSSVVGICSLGKPTELSPSILTMPDASHRFTKPETLGVVCGQQILSCAHIQDTYQTMPGEVDLFAAWCLNEPEITQGVFCAKYASSLDYLVLAPDSLSVGMSEDGGTESGLQMLIELEDKFGAGIQPAVVELAPGCDEAKFSGYFFGADGRTIYPSRFRLHRGSPFIEFFSNDFAVGCAGSPIFTASHQLIGFTTFGTARPGLNGFCHCCGRRLDCGLPKLIMDTLTWDQVRLPTEADGNPTEDLWQVLDQNIRKELGQL
jgi:hypothetical protein